MLEGKVHQTIAAENQVRVRQGFAQQVQLLKANPWPCVLPIRFDQFFNNVTADVLDARQVDLAHPMEIATGKVDDRLNAQPGKPLGQRFDQSSRLRPFGSDPRYRFTAFPDVQPIDVGKHLARWQMPLSTLSDLAADKRF